VTGWRGEAGRGAAALASAAVTDHSRGDDSGAARAPQLSAGPGLDFVRALAALSVLDRDDRGRTDRFTALPNPSR